jgi:hypothetical protein
MYQQAIARMPAMMPGRYEGDSVTQVEKSGDWARKNLSATSPGKKKISHPRYHRVRGP